MTYVNAALGHESCIDHIFVTNSLVDDIMTYKVLCMDNNFSDHRPISAEFNIPVSVNMALPRPKRYAVRWDKCNLPDFYEASRNELSCVAVDNACATCADTRCTNVEHYEAISDHYRQIVTALINAAQLTVPRIPCNSLKPFWTHELDELKDKSVFLHSLWRDSGSPSNGWLCRIKNSCKFKYKLAIKQALHAYEHSHDDELNAHFLNKNIPEFWKVWNRKFKKSVEHDISIHGLQDSKLIAEEFRNHFASVYNRVAVDSSQCADNAGVHFSNDFDKSSITFELIAQNIETLKLRKASGPDELMAEHLLHAHPSLVFHLCVLFRSMAVHSFVSDAFGCGIIVPLIKDKAGDIQSVNN